MHWIDAASEEFLAHLAAGLPGHRVLLVLTTRPGLRGRLARPAAGGDDHRRRPRRRATSDGMVRTLLGADEVSEQLFKILADKSEGNPLYVEEILHQLQETGGIAVENGEARLSRADVTVPATIHDIIAARVDRLADALKHTLQGGGGGGTTLRNLAASPASSRSLPIRWPGTSGSSTASTSSSRAPQEPELMYSFKHALTQDVVYAGVLERRRRDVPRGGRARSRGAVRRAASTTSSSWSPITSGAGRCGTRPRPICRQAAVKAQRRSAHREALASLEEALEALRHLPETPETREQGIDVRLELRGSLYPLGEFEKMLAYLREAEAMASAISDARRLGLVSIHTAEYLRQTGRFAEARTLAEQALAMGDKLQDVPLQLYAGQYLGLACHALGDYRRASELLRAVTQSPQPEGRTGAFGGMVIGSWDGVSGDHPRLARALSRGAGGVRRGRRRRPPGGGPRRRTRQPVQPRGRLPRAGVHLASSRETSTRHAPCSSAPAASPVRRTSRCCVRRPPGSWAAPTSWPGGSTRASPSCERPRTRSSPGGS